MNIGKSANKLIGKIVNLVTSSVSQTSVKSNNKEYEVIEGISQLCEHAAAESFVLLKNDNNVLPLSKDKTTAVFGSVQFDPFYVGFGSGGDVNAHYTVSFSKGLHNSGLPLDPDIETAYKKWRKHNPPDNGYWGHWPMHREDMPLSNALVSRAADSSDCAVYLIGRAAGEDRENTLSEGSFYLTTTERQNIQVLKRYFTRLAVILNIGSIMDLSWIEEYHIPCVGICWLGGMEAGNALAKVLSGEISPSGKLTDTAAISYEDYPSADNFGNKNKNLYEEDIFVGYRYFDTFAPEKILLPFGFGLSYTSFTFENTEFTEQNDEMTIRISVRNTGACAGRETVQIYYACDTTQIALPEKQLIAFKKTKLLAPGETEQIELQISKSSLASFDDTGTTGFFNAYVLPSGKYTILFGTDSRRVTAIGSFTLQTAKCLQTVQSIIPPQPKNRLQILRPIRLKNGVCKTYVPAPTYCEPLKERILSGLPETLSASSAEPLHLSDVAENNALLDTFIAQMTDEELEAISRGDYVMNSPLGPAGNAGVFGGVTESLRKKGVAPVTTTDGPSGIRIAACASLLPCGTALACTWDPDLIASLYELIGKEMLERGSDVLLAPGMNIHRNPLCGRNFEYFSEDPLVSGESAAAVIKGLSAAGANGCPKHFACNNQEVNRTKNDSVLSERALREIYLKGFEICVKKADPHVLMTSYNKINGVWGHYHYALVTEILRNEWGYRGVVITDWWMQRAVSPEFPALRDQAYRVRAGVDVLMPGGNRAGKRKPDGTLLAALDTPGGITRGELQATAKHVVSFLLHTNKVLPKEEEKIQNDRDEL